MSAYKPIVGIVGPSGSGKSTSLENLDPATTRILDAERKGFPFKGADKFKIMPVSNAGEFAKAFKACVDPKAPGYDANVKVVVVESFGKVSEQILTFCQQQYKNYDIYGNYAKMIRQLLNDCKNENAAVAFTAIDQIVDIPNPDGSTSARRCIEVAGKELRGIIEREFLMVLFTDPKRNKEGRMEYWFATQTDGITTAKTPKGMFDTPLIPNDLAAALKRAEEYFK